jgi:segregation and condensation protein A
MATYEVKLQSFSGPLDTLLELIEARKLDIATVSLAEVTVDFLEYLKKLGPVTEPAILADFLVVASKLVLIKSKQLLPDLTLSEEEEAGIQDLEARLALYREFAARNGGASAHIGSLWSAANVSYARPFLFGMQESGIFFPADNITPRELMGAMDRLSAAVAVLLPEGEKVKAQVVKLEEKIQELVARCRDAAVASFKSMSDKRTRSEVVVMFLALLHLLKERMIAVEQSDHFSDIIVKNQTPPSSPDGA